LVAHTPFSSILSQVSTSITQYNIGAALLIAGQDDKSMGHLSMIEHPGASIIAGRSGFFAIGQWLPAVTCLNLRCHTKETSMFDGLRNVIAAKRAAEFSQGVGKITDVAVIADQRTTFLSRKIIEEIATIDGQNLTIEQRTELEDHLNKELGLSAGQ
jgi:20S proteasome alpha/beta subunit